MKEIKLTQGKLALVDDEDYEYLSQWKWYAKKDTNSKTFYAARNAVNNSKKRSILMHRVVLNLMNSELLCDHKDHDGLNNQTNNLRLSTKSGNGANVDSYKNSTSKYLGVFWDKHRNKWKVDVRKNKRTIFIGRFESEEQAAIAYNNAALEIHGEFANLNKIAV